MSKFDLRNGLLNSAKNEIKQPYSVMKTDANGKLRAYAAFTVEGKKAVTADKFSDVKKAIKAGDDEYKVSVAGEVVAGTGGLLKKKPITILCDSEDLIANLEGYFGSVEETTPEPAKEEKKPADAIPSRNGKVENGIGVAN